jgi:hypothetical protein
MRKFFVFIPVILVYFLIGCNGEEEIATPSVRTSVIDDGTGVRFEWDPVDGAEGYRVYVDGNMEYEGENTYFEWTTPALEIKIVAYSGDKESAPRTFDFSLEESEVTVWDAIGSGPDQPSYVLFSDGVASAVNADQKGNAWLLFVSDSISSNNHNNSNIDAAFADYDGTDLAPDAGIGAYQTRDEALQGSKYFIWFEFSPIDGNIDDDDYFAIVEIISKTGEPAQYQVKFYFQKFKGLRWLKK